MRTIVAVVLASPFIASVALGFGVCAYITLEHCGVGRSVGEAVSWMLIGSAATIGVQMVADLVHGKI